VACFLQGRDALSELLATWQRSLGRRPVTCIIVADPASALIASWRKLTRPPAFLILRPRDAGLLEKPFPVSLIQARLHQHLAGDGASRKSALLVDMDWLLQAPSAMANGSIWGTIVERLLAAGAYSCLSVYHRRHLPERDLLSGLHAHATVLAADGLHVNPFQLPTSLAAGTSTSQSVRLRLDHWLTHLSETLRPQPHEDDPLRTPLSGTDSSDGLRDQVTSEDETRPPPWAVERWKIRCFGSLRIYRADGKAIDWHSDAGQGKPGSARKVRGLFAMLLMSGDRGMPAAELIDVLWPDASSPDNALNRLHQTVTELRRRLLPAVDAAKDLKARLHPYVVRLEQRYFLRLPPDSWIDVDEFPQLCRQGGDLLREGRLSESLLCFESALKLYTGDLFADLPAAMTEGADADWCASSRAWLRELYFKVHGDCARIHRELNNPLQAVAHCQQMLQQDASSDFAHAELMRIHAAQGRRDTLERQFQLYRHALSAAGHPDMAPLPLMGLYVELMRDTSPGKTLRSQVP
jgi:two-component SAPR family response regulator